MEKIGFIKNRRLLDETHEVEDLLDFSSVKRDLKLKLNRIDKSNIFALVGQYGTGKSTLLHQLAIEDTENKWLVFDAWKFPERSNLWEGFVLEFIKNTQPELFKKYVKKIDGRKHTGWKIFFSSIFKVASILKPGTDISSVINGLFNSSPIRRVYEFFELLEGFINEHTDEYKSIYVVIEDIDRSGDKGVFFLETLKQFIRTSNLSKKVTCIVPVSNVNFEGPAREAYIKTVDYKYKFNPRDIDFSKFISRTFKDVPEEKNYHQHLNILFKNLLSYANIRELKSIIRNADLSFAVLSQEDRVNYDIRLFLLFFALAYLFLPLRLIQTNNLSKLHSDMQWLLNFIILLAVDKVDIKGYKTDIPIYFIDNKEQVKPALSESFRNFEGIDMYVLSNIYLGISEG